MEKSLEEKHKSIIAKTNQSLEEEVNKNTKEILNNVGAKTNQSIDEEVNKNTEEKPN